MNIPTEPTNAVVILIYDHDNDYGKKYAAIARQWIEADSSLTKITETTWLARFPEAFPTLTKIVILQDRLDEPWIHILAIPCGKQVFGALPAPLKTVLADLGLSVWSAEYPKKDRPHYQ